MSGAIPRHSITENRSLTGRRLTPAKHPFRESRLAVLFAETCWPVTPIILAIAAGIATVLFIWWADRRRRSEYASHR